MKNIDINPKIKEILDKYKYFIIVILVGVCFMMISHSEKSQDVLEESLEYKFDVELKEQKLEQMLSQVYGVGKVSVMLATDETSENIYATNTQDNYQKTESSTTRDTKEDMILVSKSGGTNEPVKIKDVYPKISGALIVCEGADSSEVRLNIISAVKSICNVSSEKITITKMKD